MRTNLFFLAGLAVSLTSCVVTPEKFLHTVVPAVDPAYGYDAAHAIPIKNGDMALSIASSYYFLNHLQTNAGKSLRVVRRVTVHEPAHHTPLLKAQNPYTGQPMYNVGLVDAYTLVSQGDADTVRLYLNIYRTGPLQVPYHLQLVADEKP